MPEKIKNHISGPLDIIGDVHGCYDELLILLKKLDYQLKEVAYDSKSYGLEITHPDDRKVVFVGDLVNKGPDSLAVFKLTMSMINQEKAFCVKGNHEVKIENMLNGEPVKKGSSRVETAKQLARETKTFKSDLMSFLQSLPSHIVFDKNRLAVAHAGIKEYMQGNQSDTISNFCIYGESKDDLDKTQVPVRYDWAEEYKGKAKVVYGHTPVAKTAWINHTINIDTGCVYGGHLTALRYPENELVSVKAKEVYIKPSNTYKKSKENL